MRKFFVVGKYLSEFLKILYRKEIVEDLLWNLLFKEDDGKIFSIVFIILLEYYIIGIYKILFIKCIRELFFGFYLAIY